MSGRVDRATVAEVLGAVLGVAVPADHGLARKDLPVWDSVKHVEVVFALEDAFEVQIPEDVMGRLDSTDAIVSTLESLRAA